MGDGVEVEPDWDDAAQLVPDFEVDQRIRWWGAPVVKIVDAYLWVNQAAFRSGLASLFFGVFGLRWTSSMRLQSRALPDQRVGFA